MRIKVNKAALWNLIKAVLVGAVGLVTKCSLKMRS